MNATWAWILLLIMWGTLLVGVGKGLAIDELESFGIFMLVVTTIIALVYGSIVFLAYYNAWPFIAQ